METTKCREKFKLGKCQKLPSLAEDLFGMQSIPGSSPRTMGRNNLPPRHSWRITSPSKWAAQRVLCAPSTLEAGAASLLAPPEGTQDSESPSWQPTGCIYCHMLMQSTQVSPCLLSQEAQRSCVKSGKEVGLAGSASASMRELETEPRHPSEI